MIVYRDIVGKLKDAGYSSYRIREEGIIAEGTMQSLRTGKPVNIKTLDLICQLLRCKIEDIVTIVIDDENA